MRPIVDIIADVVTAMKPTFDVTPSVAGQVVTFTDTNYVTHKLFVGERIKAKDGSADSGWHYGTVTTITDGNVFTVTFTDLTDASVGIPEVVLNYHHGHGLEIVNTFIEITKSTSKLEQFPAICLLQDITEKVTVNGYEREADLNIIILTDSKQTYKAADRYTNTFEPILYNLYDLFMERLEHSNYVSPEDPPHDKTDRLAWGKSGLYGNTANIFNDFIDAIEIDNLKIKTFKTC